MCFWCSIEFKPNHPIIHQSNHPSSSGMTMDIILNNRRLKNCFALAAAVLFCVLSVSAQDANGKYYRSRQIGDKAFSDGYYSLAVKFYTQYKNEAADDQAALKDSYCCLFSAHVGNRDAKNARTEFQEFSAKFADEIAAGKEFAQRADYWNANILVLEGELDLAIDAYNRILKTAPDISDIYAESLSGLAAVWVIKLNWDEAEKTYLKLEAVGKGTRWADYARKQRILVAIYKGDIEKARSMLNAGDSKNVTDVLLTVFLLVKEGKLAEADEMYKKIRSQAQGPDSLWFLASFNLANAYLDKKNLQSALVYQKDAEFFAESEIDKEKMLLQMINSQALSGNNEGAIGTCQRFLKNYPNSSSSGRIMLQLARMLMALKKYQEAVNIYKEMLNSPKIDNAMKLSAAREAGQVFIAEKLYNEAREKFNYIVENAQDRARKFEARIQLADILCLEKKYSEGAAAFEKIAGEDPMSREPALLKQVNAVFEMKDYQKAFVLLGSYMKEFDRGASYQSAYFLYGMTLLKLRKFDDAAGVFADFAKRFPENTDAPRAWFEMGNIGFDSGNYKMAEENYSKILETYPKDEIAPNALYKRLYAHFLSGGEEAAGKDLELLRKNYSDSLFTVKGLFWQADFLRDGGKFDKAEAVLQELAAKYAAKPSVASEAIYESAYICSKAGKNDKAVKYLDELSEKFPNESIVSEGFMLRGDILSEANEFEKAIPFYTKAAERRPGSNLETACWGRLGDCYFSIAWKTPDNSNIMTATDYFRKIIARTNISLNFRDQAVYKLAKCDETIGDKGSALARYREIIYGYQADKDKGEIRDPVWLIKAAQAAARLYLEKETPEAAEAAVSIYRKLVALNMEPKDDFTKMIREIREKFKLKE